MQSWHALLNIANKPCAICSQGAHKGQHMNGVKVGNTTIFLDIMAGSNIRHALGFGALCKLQCLLQVLGVGIVAGHGCHNLNLCLFLGNPMGGIQSCLDQLWQIWEGFFHLGHNDVPWPAFCAHAFGMGSGSLGFHNRLAG